MVAQDTAPRRRRFPPRPSSVRAARQMIRDCLADAGRDDLTETAELLVSEIVTNALVHAGTSIDVAFSLVDGGLRVEVTDGSPHVPALRGYGPSAGTGRGLMLLEQMVDDWGVVAAEPGKTVWFQMASNVDGHPTAAPEATARAEVHAIAVSLLGVPLLLHEAWRQHAESLLREYLLVSLELDSPEAAITAHAQASDAIALLAEQIPPSGITEDASEIMVSAAEPNVSSPLVEVRVPEPSVPHFATLERTILMALEMIDDGDFLSPPTQPEVQQLRAWLCGQVLEQSQGAAPLPWGVADLPEPGRHHPPEWDSSPVLESGLAMIAADDEDRIVAASPTALTMLGYDDQADLVGRRLVDLVPERYRQAHLAGFTLHFLTGRAPLLGHAVVVPMLRRDGSEREVEMTISAERAADGRSVFVASLRPLGVA